MFIGDIMVKKYIKKLIFTGFFYVMYIFVAAIVAFFLSTVNNEAHNETPKLIASLLLAWPIACFVVYYVRIDNRSYKLQYLQEHYGQSFRFLNDFKATLIEKNSLLDLLAFVTLIVLHGTSIAISTGVTFGRYVIGTALMVLLEGTSFAVGNAFIWTLVHKRWKGRKRAQTVQNTPDGFID